MDGKVSEMCFAKSVEFLTTYLFVQQFFSFYFLFIIYPAFMGKNQLD